MTGTCTPVQPKGRRRICPTSLALAAKERALLGGTAVTTLAPQLNNFINTLKI